MLLWSWALQCLIIPWYSLIPRPWAFVTCSTKIRAEGLGWFIMWYMPQHMSRPFCWEWTDFTLCANYICPPFLAHDVAMIPPDFYPRLWLKSGSGLGTRLIVCACNITSWCDKVTDRSVSSDWYTLSWVPVFQCMLMSFQAVKSFAMQFLAHSGSKPFIIMHAGKNPC